MLFAPLALTPPAQLSRALACGDAPPQPSAQAARRAMRFMLARLNEPVTTAQIARASSLSVRTLHRAVLREYGAPPMALLRRARLHMVRAELQVPGSETTVTRTAMQWGFTHLGRFAGEYAGEFGESPSQTLQRTRHLSRATGASGPGWRGSGRRRPQDNWRAESGAA